jgi:hypothetical protein
VGQSFHGAAVSYTRGCPLNIGRCLRLVHLASVSVFLPLSAHLSAISFKYSPLCLGFNFDKEGEKA